MCGRKQKLKKGLIEWQIILKNCFQEWDIKIMSGFHFLQFFTVNDLNLLDLFKFITDSSLSLPLLYHLLSKNWNP